MRHVTRVVLAGGAVVTAFAVPLAASGSGFDPATTPTEPPPNIDVAAMDPNGVLAAARVRFDEYLTGFAGLESDVLLSDCPLIAVEDLLTAIASVGRDSITADVDATIHVAEVPSEAVGTSPAAAQFVPIGVVCDTNDADEVRPDGMSGGVYGAGIAAFDYGLAPEIDLSEIPAQFPDAVEPSPESLGFTAYHGCLGGDAEAGTVQCYAWWERDRFVLGLYVTIDRDAVDASLGSLQGTAQTNLVSALTRFAQEGFRAADMVPATTSPTG